MTHRRVVVTTYGGPEVLQVVDERIRAPGPGECSVRVLRAGVARADIMMRRGMYPNATPPLPLTPGYDIAGVVEEIGRGVSRLEVGQTVTGLIKAGGYTEYAVLSEDKLHPVSPSLDLDEVICLPLNYVAAYQMLHRFAGVEDGDRVLFHGASGGVGTALLQLGALRGLEMYGTASRINHDLVTDLGGTPIDYEREDFVGQIHRRTPQGVDAIFDHIGGRHLWRSFQALAPGGKLIAFGELSMVQGEEFNEIEEAIHNQLLEILDAWPNQAATFYELDPEEEMIDPEWYREDLTTLLELLAEDQIHPIVAERLPLAKAAHAHAMLEKGGVRGKVILICGEVKH